MKSQYFWPLINHLLKQVRGLSKLISFFTGLSKRTTTEGLHAAFAKFGEVVHGIVVNVLKSSGLNWIHKLEAI